MKTKLVVADGFDPALFSDLCTVEAFDTHPEAKVSQNKLSELLADVEALVIRSATQVNAELLEKAPKLKYVIRAGEGTDNIDKVACQAKGIKVTNTPGANNNSAAEHAIALMLTALRKTAWAHKTMSEGGWDKSKYNGVELSNKKVGIVGFGRIGQIVAKRLAGFEPDILFYDPFLEKSDIPYATKAKSLEEIFSTCDIVTIHVPLMDATKGLITKELLKLMPAHSVLINASRGGICDEDALFQVLKNKKIRAAAFDVFATEPLPSSSELRKLENIVLTPHLGASTEEAQVRVGGMVISQLKEYFINNNLLNEVKA